MTAGWPVRAGEIVHLGRKKPVAGRGMLLEREESHEGNGPRSQPHQRLQRYPLAREHEREDQNHAEDQAIEQSRRHRPRDARAHEQRLGPRRFTPAASRPAEDTRHRDRRKQCDEPVR